jgi:hypothetical protein
LASSDHPTAPFTLTVQLNSDDYGRYFALVGKRQSSWSNFIIFLVAAFSAILVALASRALASLETTDSAAIELVGRFSLFAYAVGVLALLLLSAIIRRRGIAAMLAGTPNAFEPKTVVIADDSVAISGQLSQVTYTWPAIGQLTVARELLCLWIGTQSAIVIPARAFATDETRRSAIVFIEEKIAAAKKAI